MVGLRNVVKVKQYKIFVRFFENEIVLIMRKKWQVQFNIYLIGCGTVVHRLVIYCDTQAGAIQYITSFCTTGTTQDADGILRESIILDIPAITSLAILFSTRK